jgi:hypothetical protein
MSVADFNNAINRNLGFARSNTIISSVLKLFLIMYGSYAAPNIKPQVAPYLSNPYVRVGVMALVIWTVDFDVGLAILIAVVFLMTTRHLVRNAAVEVGAAGGAVKGTALQLLANGGLGPVPVGAQIGTPQKILQNTLPAVKDTKSAPAAAAAPQAYTPDDVALLANI